MNVVVDTSAFLALLDASEQNHEHAGRIWRQLVEQDVLLFCTSFILVETAALLQNRLGLSQLRAFHKNVFPFLRVLWVDAALYNAGMTALLTANRRRLSLVDCVTFAAMRQTGLNTAFAFDTHFSEQGFELLR